ncbi:MAG: CARDB domain-containing protein, partial [Planctomycetota bacterium]
PQTSGGTYRVVIVSEAGAGDYVLAVEGATGQHNTGPRVIATNPTQNQVFGAPPTALDITFSEALLPGSLDIDDLTLDGGATVDSVDLINPTTARFSITVPAVDGTYSYQIPTDAVRDLQDVGGSAFNGAFIVDKSGPEVIAQSPTEASEQAPPFTLATFTFNETIDPASVSPADIVSFTGPSGQDLKPAIQSVSVTGAVNLRVAFGAQTEGGTYTLVIGPDIRDTRSNPMDQNGNGVGGEPEDTYTGLFNVDNPGPRILDITPVGTVPATVSAVDITFNEAIDLATFTPDDIVIDGPDGAVNVTSVFELATHTYRAIFDAQSTSGTYNVAIGPDITDLGAIPMDQNGNGVDAEPEDAFTSSFIIDNTGPTVVDHTPGDVLNSPFDSFTFDFSETVLANTVSPADATLTGPDGAVTITSVQALSSTRFRFNFVQQTAPGAYTFTVGPDILDLVGNAMDQNANGQFGEPTDAFSATTSLSFADLDVEAITAPASVNTGAPLTIEYTVANRGGADAVGSWFDRVVVSSDEFFGNPDDIIIGTHQRAGGLAVNDTYTASLTSSLPFGLEGDFTVFIVADINNQVREPNEDNNTAIQPIRIDFVAPPADLIVDAVTVTDTAGTGTPYDVAWRVTNNGTAATNIAGWVDRVYLSSDDQFGGDTLLGSFNRSGVLEAGGSYAANQTFTLDRNLPAGDYHVFVVTDANNDLNEPAAEDNNTGRSLAPISVFLSPIPDLTVTDIDFPATANIDQTITVDWTVQNAGGADANNTWTDRVYLSTDGQVAGATLLGTLDHGAGLPATQSLNRSLDVTLPVLPDGPYQIVVVTDATNQVFERDLENNNTTASIDTLALTHPDLIVLDPTAPTDALSGDTVTVHWTVQNTGTGPASGNWTDRVYLSADDQFGGDTL